MDVKTRPAEATGIEDGWYRLAIAALLGVVALAGICIGVMPFVFHTGPVGSRTDLVAGPVLVGVAGYNVQRLRAHRPVSTVGLHVGVLVSLSVIVVSVASGGKTLGGDPLLVGALALVAHLLAEIVVGSA
jgi:hypothetical protein